MESNATQNLSQSSTFPANIMARRKLCLTLLLIILVIVLIIISVAVSVSLTNKSVSSTTTPSANTSMLSLKHKKYEKGLTESKFAIVFVKIALTPSPENTLK